MACYSGSLSGQLGQKVGIAWLLKYQNFPLSFSWQILASEVISEPCMPPEAQTYLVLQCTYTQTCTLHINIIISFINSNITFSWTVVGCILHQPTSDVRSHVYPDDGPLYIYVCVHYYSLPLHVMHGTYTLCISPTITTYHFVIVVNKKLASGGQFSPA